MQETHASLLIESSLRALVDVLEGGVHKHSGRLIEAARIVTASLETGGKLLICGNGGSAADAQHIAAEFVNRFRLERRALPAVALTTDSSVLTSIANDYSFDEVFAKQVAALAGPKDVLLAISTSGASPNIRRALDTSRHVGARSILFTGGTGGEAARHAELVLCAPSADTPRIQEVHIFWGHVLCELVERSLFA